MISVEDGEAAVRHLGLRRVLLANPGADIYGSDLQMLESVRAMRAAGVEVVVVCPGPGPLVELLNREGADVQVRTFPVVRRAHLSVPGMARLAKDVLFAAPGMVRAIRDIEPDVVYVNTTTLPWWIGVSRLMRVPVLCHVHEAEDLDNIWMLRVLNAPLLLSSRLILISHTAAHATWRIYPSLRSRSVVVMNGIPDRASPPVPPPGVAGITHLAVVGRLSPRKGTHTAIAAARLLHERGLDVRLEVAGTVFPGYQWYEEELRALVFQQGLSDVVSFTGYVSPSFIAFDRADIVLAPSIREPFGNAVVEALLSERPVVAAAAGGHLETVLDGETGLLVPVSDPVAAADAVESLIADPEAARRLASSARQSARRAFGAGRYRREVLEILTEMVGQTLDRQSRP